MQEKIHFEGLNGLRSMAVLVVVISHVTIHLDFLVLTMVFLATIKMADQWVGRLVVMA